MLAGIVMVLMFCTSLDATDCVPAHRKTMYAATEEGNTKCNERLNQLIADAKAKGADGAVGYCGPVYTETPEK